MPSKDVFESMEHSERNIIGKISWLSSALVGSLALASFSLSFGALQDLAVREKVVSESLGFVFPLVVDGAIVVFSLCALRASLRKESAWLLRSLVVLATIGSVFFNIMHVGESWLARSLAATPPLLLFLSFEALMHSIQKEMERGIEEAKQEAEKPLSKEARITAVKRFLGSVDKCLFDPIADGCKENEAHEGISSFFISSISSAESF